MSNLSRIKELYQRNPVIHLPIYRMTRSDSYKETLKLLDVSAQWTDEELENWTLCQCRAIVDYAVRFVPWYQKAYRSVGLESGDDINSLADLEGLPTVTKQLIKEDPSQFISKQPGIHWREFCTSGTSMPFSFRLDESFVGREQAFFDRYWMREGGYVCAKDRCIVLRGGGKNARHFEYNQVYNYKIFDSDYSEDAGLLPYYDREIRKFRAAYMQGYPSSVYALAQNYLASDLKPPHFQTIFLGSENVLEYQVETIRKAFCPKRVLFHYGHSEEVLLALRRKSGSGYRFLPAYGHCEIVDDSGRPVAEGEMGEIIGTTWNRSMPFIRYRTNDYATKAKKNSGFACEVDTIEGRRQEFVVREDGTNVSIVSICAEHMPVMSKCREMQFEQFRPGELTINCVFYEDSDAERISREMVTVMEAKFEHKVRCSVEAVDHIEKLPSGKNVMLVQHIE